MSIINDDSSINENILQLYKIKNDKKAKYSKKLVIFVSLISFFIIFIITFLVLYFIFGCFQYKQDNITKNLYQPNQIMLLSEEKNVTTTIVSKNETETNIQKLFNHFLVSIESKTRLNYLGVIDYLYNASIIILQSKIDDIIVIGHNYTDINNEFNSDYLLNPQDAIISTFSFYENGTLGEIYLSKNTTDYFGSLIIDLIEQLIPRISSNLYKNKNEKIEFTYDIDNKDENDSIINITENHFEKAFKDKYSNISFNESKTTKIIKRRISNDTIEEVICDSTLNLISGNKANKNKENKLDFGLKSYNVRIISYLNLISKIKDEKLNDIIKLIIKKFNFIESHNYFKNLRNKNGSYNKEEENRKENMHSNLTNGKSSMSNSKNKALRNLDFFETKSKDFGQREFIFNFPDFDILNKHFEPKLVIYFSPLDQKIGFSINIFIDKEEKTLVSKEVYNLAYSYDKNYFERSLIEIPFEFIIPLKISIKYGVNYGINFLLDLKYKDIDTFFSALIQPNIHEWISGELSTNFPVINLGVRAKGDVVGARGDILIFAATYEKSYIEGNLTLFSGPTELNAFVEFKYLPEINFLFIHIKAKKVEKEITLFRITNGIERIEKTKHIFGNPKPRPKPEPIPETIPEPEKENKTFSHAFYLHNILIIFLFLIF